MLRRLLSLCFVSSVAIAQGDPAVANPPAVASPLLPPGIAESIREQGIEHSHAMSLLRDLTGKIGHRLTGSDNFTRACDWASQEFHAMGVPSVQLEKWSEWHLAWNRGAWIGRITNPVDMELYVATDAWTAGTNGPTTGVIVHAPTSVDEVTPRAVAGKWVYYSKRPKKEVREACEALGILGWLYRAGDPDAKFPLRVRVFGDYHTALLPIDKVPTLPQIAIRADQADALAELLGAGKEVTGRFDIQNTFRDGGIPLYNVIAEIPGSEKPDEVVIVCGHLDSWHQAQGCTDNGTGATSTMEAARILMAVGAKPKRTIRFCLWGGEEEGLLGSHAYVQRHRAEMDKVSAVFNHDTGTNWAQSITVTNAMAGPLEAVFAPVMQLMTPPERSFERPVFEISKVEQIGGGFGGGSDHASFLSAGVPALNWGLTGRSNYFLHTWHTQWDTIDVAVEEYQRHTATVIAFAALGTANLEQRLDRAGVVGGSGGQSQSKTYAEAMFDAETDGLTFTSVTAGGRAAAMGVKAGDTLLTVNDEEIEMLRDIFRVAREAKGDELVFVLQRGKEKVEARMKKGDLRRQ